eukprot:COSAG02_NODE_6687_length_3420_cov_3.538392_3_plen_45_part_00
MLKKFLHLEIHSAVLPYPGYAKCIIVYTIIDQSVPSIILSLLIQ